MFYDLNLSTDNFLIQLVVFGVQFNGIHAGPSIDVILPGVDKVALGRAQFQQIITVAAGVILGGEASVFIGYIGIQ